MTDEPIPDDIMQAALDAYDRAADAGDPTKSLWFNIVTGSARALMAERSSAAAAAKHRAMIADAERAIAAIERVQDGLMAGGA